MSAEDVGQMERVGWQLGIEKEKTFNEKQLDSLEIKLPGIE